MADMDTGDNSPERALGEGSSPYAKAFTFAAPPTP